MTFHELIQESIQTLSKYHPDTAKFEINHLIKHCFKISQEKLLLSLTNQVENKTNLNIFKGALDERIKGKPIDLIIGTSEFCGHTYYVEEGVLIPRPETEWLVQAALSEVKSNFGTDSFTSIELGFGSGVISIELALNFQKAKFYAWDISEKSYNLAKKNAVFHNVNQIQFYQNNFFEKEWLKHVNPKIPFLFVSNPPYIATNELANLDDSVINYDPISALDGGDTGLNFYQKCFDEFKQHKVVMIFEIGFNQKEEIVKLLRNFHQFKYKFKKDFAGKNRILIIKTF